MILNKNKSLLFSLLKGSSKAIQASIAVGLLVFICLYLFITGRTCNSLLRRLIYSNDKRLTQNNGSNTTYRKKKKTLRDYIKNHCRKVFSNTFLLMLMLSLTLLQILLIHIFKLSFKQSLVSYRNNGTLITKVCNQLENGLFSEEMIYLLFTFPSFILLLFSNRSKRFTNFIMSKYHLFFNSNVFKNKKKQQKDKQRKREEAEYSNLRKCQRCWKKTTNSCMCKFLCWAFCCGCCAENNKTKHGCLGDCIGQSDFCKALKAIKCLLSFLLCCTFWKGATKYLWAKHKVTKEKRKREKKRVAARDIDDDENVSDDDLAESTEVVSSSIPSFRFPHPIKPFSTTNRLLSVAIYVAYTYDILNIFMTLYSSYMVLPVVSVINDRKGVLFDLLLQIIQVIVIGFKFYPILAIADMDPSIATCLLGFLNVTLIWVVKVIKKGFCSKTEAFIRFTVEKLSDEFNKTKVFAYDRLNIDTNLTTSDLTERYLNVIKDKLPSIFESEFSYNENSDGQIYGSTTLSPLINTTKYSFRKKASNKTHSVINDILNDWEQDENDVWISIRNFLENLPLYLSLSYLVSRYLISIIDVSIRWYFRSCGWCKLPNKSKQKELASRKILVKTIRKTHQNVDLKDDSLRQSAESLNIETYENYRFKQLQTTNYNYSYIRQLIKHYVKICKIPRNANRNRIDLSKTLSLFHNIYKPIKYLRFSKSFVNTYTVAFMVVYFFSVFLLRMSSIFGDWYIRGIDFMYQLIFRNLDSSFPFDNHNIFTEFSIACLLTSGVTIIQLLLSIRSFKEYVMWLHRGGRYDKTDSNKYERINLRKVHHDQSKINTMMTSHSMHFPGYLIAHLVYGYVILFLVLFGLILVCKILWYLPQTLDLVVQIFLPIIIMIALKVVGMKFLTKAVFLRESSERITNLTPYYTASYFNFFFDCFLGLIACLTRVWQTTVISLICLPRLDITIFNQQNELIMKQLDKGHLAFINFVHMEHYYNNPVLNGFCDILIETLFQSYILEDRLNKKAGIVTNEDRHKFNRYLSQVSRNDAQNFTEHEVFDVSEIIHSPTKQDEKKFNFDNVHESFRYESYRRLCNIFKLYYLLKTHEELRRYTRYNIEKKKQENKLNEIKKQEEITKNKKKKVIRQLKSIFGKVKNGPKKLGDCIKSPDCAREVNTDNDDDDDDDDYYEGDINDNYYFDDKENNDFQED